MEGLKLCEIIVMSISECNSDSLKGIKGFMTHLFMCVTHIFATAYAEYMCLRWIRHLLYQARITWLSLDAAGHGIACSLGSVFIICIVGYLLKQVRVYLQQPQ